MVEHYIKVILGLDEAEPNIATIRTIESTITPNDASFSDDCRTVFIFFSLTLQPRISCHKYKLVNKKIIVYILLTDFFYKSSVPNRSITDKTARLKRILWESLKMVPKKINEDKISY